MKAFFKKLFAYIVTFIIMFALLCPISVAISYSEGLVLKLAVVCVIVVWMIFGSVVFYWVCDIMGIQKHEL